MMSRIPKNARAGTAEAATVGSDRALARQKLSAIQTQAFWVSGPNSSAK